MRKGHEPSKVQPNASFHKNLAKRLAMTKRVPQVDRRLVPNVASHCRHDADLFKTLPRSRHGEPARTPRGIAKASTAFQWL